MLGLPQDNNSSFLTDPAIAPARIRESFHSSSANSFTEQGIDFSDERVWTIGAELSNA
ncbi:MAG: arginase [Gammaproteobacteria bacterium]|jgi:arginase